MFRMLVHSSSVCECTALTQQYTHTQSQAPEDECTSIRNMLRKKIKQVTSVGLSLFNYQDDAGSNKHKMERYLRVDLLGPSPRLLLKKKKNLPGRGLTEVEKHWSTGICDVVTTHKTTVFRTQQHENFKSFWVWLYRSSSYVLVLRMLSMTTASCSPSLDKWWWTFLNTAMSPMSTVECARHLNFPQGNTKPWRNIGHTSPSDAVQYLGRKENKWLPLQKLSNIRSLINYWRWVSQSRISSEDYSESQ